MSCLSKDITTLTYASPEYQDYIKSAQGVYVPFQERQIGGKFYQLLYSYTWVMHSILSVCYDSTTFFPVHI